MKALGIFSSISLGLWKPFGIYLKVEGEMGRWGGGEMGCIRYLPLIQSSNQLLPINYQFLIPPIYFLEIPNGFYRLSK
ncbi:hypothetical protein AFK68_13420 [Hydrocoleum sp. CS-953]|nr:hypothetical protein AFK68_13420 [Hydrocoleum sp. CS-953]